MLREFLKNLFLLLVFTILISTFIFSNQSYAQITSFTKEVSAGYYDGSTGRINHNNYQVPFDGEIWVGDVSNDILNYWRGWIEFLIPDDFDGNQVFTNVYVQLYCTTASGASNSLDIYRWYDNSMSPHWPSYYWEAAQTNSIGQKLWDGVANASIISFFKNYDYPNTIY